MLSPEHTMFPDSKTGPISRPVPVCSATNLKRRTIRPRCRHREQNWAETDWINLELYPSWNNDVRKSIRIEVLASWYPEVRSPWCPEIMSSWTHELQRSRTPDLRSSWCPDFKKFWNLELSPCWNLGLVASWSPDVIFSWPQEPLMFERPENPVSEALHTCHRRQPVPQRRQPLP